MVDENIEEKNLRKSEHQFENVSTTENSECSPNNYLTHIETDKSEQENSNNDKTQDENYFFKAYYTLKSCLPEDFDLIKTSKIFGGVVIVWVFLVPLIPGFFKKIIASILLTITLYVIFFLLYKKGILKMKGGQLGDEK